MHWWNTTRLLEPLGYVPPVEFEQTWRENQALSSTERPANDPGGMNMTGDNGLNDGLVEASAN